MIDYLQNIYEHTRFNIPKLRKNQYSHIKLSPNVKISYFL